MSEDINASAWNSMREDRDYFKAAYERKLADEAKALDAALRLESELREARREWDEQISSANAALAEADRALSAERTARRVMREALEGMEDAAKQRATDRDADAEKEPRGSPAALTFIGAAIAWTAAAALIRQTRAALAAEPGEGPAAGGAERAGPITADNAPQRLSEMLMECAERFGNFPQAKADPRAWEHLLVYAPQAPDALPPEGHPRAAEVKNEG